MGVATQQMADTVGGWNEANEQCRQHLHILCQDCLALGVA